MAVPGNDRQLECDELSDGHQGLPRHHVVVRRGGGRGVPVRMRDDGAGTAAGGKPAGRSGVRLRRDDGLGRGAAAPVFPAKLGKPVDVPRMAGPVPAARPDGTADHPRLVLPLGDHLVWSAWRACEGTVLRCPLL